MGAGRLNLWGWQVYNISGYTKGNREMTYPDTGIFLMAYDMTRKKTLENVVAHDLSDMASYVRPDDFDDEYEHGCSCSWMSEVVQGTGCESDFQIILVGCKADYWEELYASGTPEQKAELTTWQQGYDVRAASHMRADAFT